jgi:hypothetical protein
MASSSAVDELRHEIAVIFDENASQPKEVLVNELREALSNLEIGPGLLEEASRMSPALFAAELAMGSGVFLEFARRNEHVLVDITYKGAILLSRDLHLPIPPHNHQQSPNQDINLIENFMKGLLCSSIAAIIVLILNSINDGGNPVFAFSLVIPWVIFLFITLHDL